MKRYLAIGLTLVCGGLAAAAGADTIDVHAKGDLRAMWVSRCWAPLEKWLWHPAIKNGKATVFFRRELQIDSSMPRLVIEIAANNGYTLYVNGKKIAQELNKRGCYELRLNEQLQPGRNVVAIEAVNTGGPGAVICGFQAYRRGSDQGEALPWAGWLCSDKAAEGWTSPDFKPRGWVEPTVVADYGDGPWKKLTGHFDGDEADSYVAFRGQFELPVAGEVEVRVMGASEFGVWIDDKFLADGLCRFPKAYPEYDVLRPHLSAGKHLLAAQVHHVGVANAVMEDLPPFFTCQLWKAGEPLVVRWRCMPLAGYAPRARKIDRHLGLIEWCDTRLLPVGWRTLEFDDVAWKEPVSRDPGIGKPGPSSIAPVRSFTYTVQPVAKGPLADRVCYSEDIAANFFLRDLVCDRLPPQGVWRRYDLGLVRLARPRFTLDLPPGAIVEFAYCESLAHGRVSPYIPHAEPSCCLDHYVAKGGIQEFFPLVPRGGRFVEIHVLADPAKVRFVREEFVERCYYDETPEGAFHCGDELLDRIWTVGIQTFRAGTDDIADEPTRERAQWTGDVMAIGMDIGSVGYSDLRVLRRGLVQSAQGARADGMVCGAPSGWSSRYRYLPTYAVQWVTGCVHYWEMTGDRQLLKEMFPYAERNFATFEPYVTKDGLTDGPGWIFVDWGYVRNPGPANIAYNLHFVEALRNMVRWCREVKRVDRIPHYEALERQITSVVSRWFDELTDQKENGWEQIGWHRAVLGLRLGFFQGKAEQDCVAFIKRHMLRCFPNDPTAPRNFQGAGKDRLITPYFSHYAFPPLIERGQMDFVLDQYRKCWGWALQEGLTTWPEVWDLRWGQCDFWSSNPSWQMSRYVLGLHTRYDLGKRHFRLLLLPGSLQKAEGRLPLPGGEGAIKVQWVKEGAAIHYHLETPVPIRLHIGGVVPGAEREVLQVDRELRRVFDTSR